MPKNDPRLIRPIRYDTSEQSDFRTQAEDATNNDAVRAAFERGELTDEDQDG